MLRKIKVQDLAVGMYVVDTGLSWLEHPYLYGQEGELLSAGAIRDIQRAGFEEAFVDTGKGAFGAARSAVDKGQAEQLAAGASHVAAAPEAPARVPLDQGLSRASAIYQDCLNIARDILGAVQGGGEVDVAASRQLIDDVITCAVCNQDALVALSKLRSHDAYTFTHGVNVSVLVVAFGAALGIETEGLKELGLAGLFHDVGKTGVSDRILNKAGRLSPDEFERVKMHPRLGCRILAGHGLSNAVLRGVGDHHERHDGSGYPLGLSGDAVHPWGRILAVADVYDALTSRRAYKEAMLPTRALGVLYGMRERDFSGELVERFIKFLGPYPVGCFVRLASGRHAFVRGSNAAHPLFPELLVVLDASGRPVAPFVLDLGVDAGGEDGIAAALDPEVFGLDALECLSRPAA